MLRQDPFEEQWYELDFRMTRWQCPHDLPQALLVDVMDAVQGLDSIIFSTMRLVDRHSFGSDASPKRFISEGEYKALRIQFEQMEDRFTLAQAEFRAIWAALTLKHGDTIDPLPDATKAELIAPDSAYSMSFSVIDVELDETYKQFLTGIHGSNKPYMAAG